MPRALTRAPTFAHVRAMARVAPDWLRPLVVLGCALALIRPGL